jgi:3-dehydroquinate dehydratase II
MRVAVLNGPNLNLLGVREPELYGRHTLGDIEAMARQEAARLDVEVEWFQTNHEGALVDAVVNPAAFGHTSLALRDAFLAVQVPFVEVHLTNIFGREPERRHTVLADLAVALIAGLGAQGYPVALRALVDHLRAG